MVERVHTFALYNSINGDTNDFIYYFIIIYCYYDELVRWVSWVVGLVGLVEDLMCCFVKDILDGIIVVVFEIVLLCFF